MHHRRPFIFLSGGVILSVLFILVGIGIAKAGDPGEVIKAEASYGFGKSLRFKLLVKANQEVKSGTVSFNAAGLDVNAVVPLGVTEIEPGIYELKTAIDLKSLALRAFSLIRFNFEYELTDGSKVPTKDYTFVYQDDRFEWQQTGPGPVRISWYAGDEAQAARLLLVAQQSLVSIYTLLSLEAPSNLNIYVYNSREDLQEARPQQGSDWNGGTLDANSGILLVALPAGEEQILQAEGQLPHSLMHIVLARQAGNSQTHFPPWLEEGLASTVEYFPNADFRTVLDHAVQSSSLLDITDLCNELPRDPANAVLAYTESASFVQYLLGEYHSDGIQRLVAAYGNGLDCETGIQAALGTSLHSLARQWRQQELGENSARTTAIQLGPWLLILAAILLLPVMGILISSRQRRKEEQIG